MFLNHHICQVHLKTHRPQPHWHCPPGLCVWHPALWVGAQQEPAKVDRESFSSKQPRHLANSVQGITRSQLHGKFYKALFAPKTLILAWFYSDQPGFIQYFSQTYWLLKPLASTKNTNLSSLTSDYRWMHSLIPWSGWKGALSFSSWLTTIQTCNRGKR